MDWKSLQFNNFLVFIVLVAVGSANVVTDVYTDSHPTDDTLAPSTEPSQLETTDTSQPPMTQQVTTQTTPAQFQTTQNLTAQPPQPQTTQNLTPQPPQPQTTENLTPQPPQPQTTQNLTPQPPQPQTTQNLTPQPPQPQTTENLTPQPPQPQTTQNLTPQSPQPQTTQNLTPQPPQPTAQTPQPPMTQPHENQTGQPELLTTSPGSSSNYTNDSRPVYPSLASSPRLVGPEVEDGLYVMFYCEVNLQTSDPRARVNVQFPYSNMATVTISPPTDRVSFHEKYLTSVLPGSLYCRVQTFWSDSPLLTSGHMYSNTFFIPEAVSTTPSYVYLYDTNEETTSLALYFAFPVTCTYRDNQGALQGCTLNLQVKSPAGVAVFSWDSYHQEVKRCQFTLRREDWRSDLKVSHNPLQPLELMSIREPTAYSRYGYMTLSVHPNDLADNKLSTKVDKDGNSYPNPWHQMGVLGNIWTYIWRRNYGGRCVSSGDPRMTTFDYSYYNAPATGVFILTRSSHRRQFEVHVRHVPCFDTWWSRGYCSVTCAIAVREGSVAYGLDACNDRNRMHRLRLSKDRLDYDPITTDASRRNWMIKMPSGASVEVYLFGWRRGMNAYVNVPPADYGKTEGLCGTYTRNRYDDYKLSDGSYVNTGGDYYWYRPREINRFVESWRIAPRESLFQKPPPPGSKPPHVGQSPLRFCTCENPIIANFKCGFDALENPVFRLGRPSEPIRSSLPWWMQWNTSQRRKRSTTGSEPDLEDIDDDYEFIDYGEDSATDDVPSWPTWNNITEDMATSDCDAFLKNSRPYQACTGSIPEDDFNNVVQKCVDDVQITGDISWADDKVSDLQSLCLHEVVNVYVNSTDNSTNTTTFNEEIFAQMEDITSALCPNDCSNGTKGTCEDGICRCHSGYIGADCSIVAGTPPEVERQIGLAQCDIRTRLCRYVQIQASDIANTADLSCRVQWSRFNMQDVETTQVEEHAGEMVSYNEIECRLPQITKVNTSDILKPYLTYSMSVSNDGVTFSGVTYNTTYLVYDSACLRCVEDNCTFEERGCWIDGQCHAACDFNPDDSTEECNPSLRSDIWSAQGATPCEWSKWDNFSDCSKPCDYGTWERTRECLRVPCVGNNTEKKVCNQFNCQELSEEIENGIILRVHDSTPSQFALVEEDVLSLTTAILDEYCIADKLDKCCGAFSLHHTDSKPTNFFNESNVALAQGYPKAADTSDSANVDALVKLLARMTSDEVQEICDVSSMGVRSREKRDADGNFIYMNKDAMLEALRPRLDEYSSRLGLTVTVEDDEPSGSPNTTIIIICVVVVVAVVAIIVGLSVGLHKGEVCAHKSKKVSPSSSKVVLGDPEDLKASAAPSNVLTPIVE